jgi:hypothetical protein
MARTVDEPNTKILRASPKARASIMLKENSISLVGAGGKNLMVLDDRGTTIKGSMSLIAGGPSIRQGGLFVNMPDFLSMIPTTIVTPVPIRVPLPPFEGLASLAKDVAFFTAGLV